MNKSKYEILSDKIVKAFVSNKIIAPLPLVLQKILKMRINLEDCVKVK